MPSAVSCLLSCLTAAAEKNMLNRNISLFRKTNVIWEFLRYLLNAHLLELLLPVFGVTVVVVRGGCELAEDAGVSIMAEVGQVGDVELEFTAVLGQG